MMFRQDTREKRIFTKEPETPGSYGRVSPLVYTCAPVPVDLEDPDIGRLDDRKARVLFTLPNSSLLKKYNVETD